MTKEDDVGMGVDWIVKFLPVCQQTMRSELTQDKAVSLPPASRDYVMRFAIFLKRQNLFLHQLNSKNNGPVLLFKTILALMSVTMDCKD